LNREHREAGMTAILWTSFYWAWVASEVVIAVATRTGISSGKIRDRGSQLILWIVIVISVTACEWLRRILPANMFAGAAWLKTASVVVLVAALAIRWTAVFTLGRSFSANVAIRESQKMMRSGLYRMVRHPSYLGLLMVFVATGIHSRNWISFVVAVVPTTAALIYRIQVEEQALQEAFGEEYAQYSQATKRLVPGVY
jgi:protein-S-isoprenylcysteine O-methyltransferase Ste14